MWSAGAQSRGPVPARLPVNKCLYSGMLAGIRQPPKAHCTRPARRDGQLSYLISREPEGRVRSGFRPAGANGEEPHQPGDREDLRHRCAEVAQGKAFARGLQAAAQPDQGHQGIAAH